MSTRMPVALKLRHLTDNNDILALQLGDGRHAFPSLAPQLRQAVFFDVQVAHDIWLAQYQAGTLKHADYHCPVKTPYPVVFLEWFDELMDRHVGCMLAEANPHWHNDPVEGQVYGVMWTLRPGDNEPRVHPIEFRLEADDAGLFTQVLLQSLAEVDYKDDRERLDKIMTLYVFTVVTALGLVNCRNVRTEVSGQVAARRSGAQKRRRQPATAVRYHTIVLPGGGSVAEGPVGQRRHRAAALHRVRGHFKHFGPEFGTDLLFGKYAGTYWWGWSVRGNAEYGAVESDYQLGEDTRDRHA